MTERLQHVELTCPHCGYVNEVTLETADLVRSNVFTCDSGEGDGKGCGLDFVWRPIPRIVYDVEIYTLEPAVTRDATSTRSKADC